MPPQKLQAAASCVAWVTAARTYALATVPRLTSSSASHFGRCGRERALRALGERWERALRALGEKWSARPGLWEKGGSARSGLWEKNGARAPDCRGAQNLWVNWSIAGVCENQHIHADVFCTECQSAAAFTARSGWGNRRVALAIALTRSPPPGH